MPATSSGFAAARDAFVAGRVREAAALAPKQAVVAGDALLAIDLWRAQGLSARGGAVARACARQFNDPLLLLEASNALVGQHRLRSAEAVLNRIVCDDDVLQARVLSRRAVHASLRGLLDDATSYARTADALGADDAVVQYALAWAAEQRREWDVALEHARRVEQLAPRWWRASIALVEILLSRGQIADADAVLARALTSGDEDANVELIAALVELSRAAPDRAYRRLSLVRERWPRLARTTSINALRAVTARLAGRASDVADAASHLRDGDVRRRLQAAPGPVRFLAAPRLAQRRNMCFPTAVAIAADAQGVLVDIARLAQQMQAHHGTEAFRGWQALQREGWRIEHVHSTVEVVRGVLDQRLPLLGLLDGIGAGHIETIIGLDDSAGLLFVRDPAQWQPQMIPVEALEHRYGGGGTLVVAVPPGGSFSPEPTWRAPDGEALVKLAAAVAAGDVVPAERIFATITTPQARAAAERLAVGVVLSPTALLKAERERALAPETPPMVRARAMLMLADSGESVGDSAGDTSTSADDGDSWSALLRARHLLGAARAEEARAVINSAPDVLTDTIEYWSLRVDVLSACGDLEGARAALATALQLEPTAPDLRQRDRVLSGARRSAAARLAAIDAERELYPDNVGLLDERVTALIDVGDGDGAHRALELLCRRRPRLPRVWARLMAFLHEQERDDLIEDALARARTMLGDEAAALDPRPRLDSDDGTSDDDGGDVDPHLSALRSAAAALRSGHGVEAALAAINGALHETLPSAQHAHLTAFEVAVAAASPARAPVEAVVDCMARRHIRERGPLWLQAFFETLLDLNPRGRGPLLALPVEAPTLALRLLLAQHHLAAGQTLRGRAALAALEADDPELPGLDVAMCQAALASGDRREARRRAERVLVNEPGHLGMRTLAHRLALAAGDVDAAVHHQRQWYRARPLMREALVETVQLVDEYEGQEAARAVVTAATQHTPAVHELLACLLDARHRLPNADARIAKMSPAAIVDDGTARAAWSMQIDMAVSKNNIEGCSFLVDAALQRFADDAGFLGWKARLALHRRQPRAAAATARAAMLRGISSPVLVEAFLADNSSGHGVIALIKTAPPAYRRAITLQLMGALGAEALPVLRDLHTCVCGFFPADVDVALGLARLWLLAGEESTALELLALARAGDPLDVELATEEATHSPPALACSRWHAIALQTGTATAWACLALARLADGQVKAAHEAIATGATIDPLSSAVLAARAALGERFDNDAIDAALAAVDDDTDLPWAHLAALEAARAIGDAVPMSWLGGAFRRVQALRPRSNLDHAERARLQVAIAAWCDAAGKPPPPGIIVDRQQLADDWPGDRWLPPQLRSVVVIRPRRGPAPPPTPSVEPSPPPLPPPASPPWKRVVSSSPTSSPGRAPPPASSMSMSSMSNMLSAGNSEPSSWQSAFAILAIIGIVVRIVLFFARG